MDAIAATSRVLLAVLLTFAALEKLRSPAGIHQVLRSLGLGWTRLWWAILCGVELSIAASLFVPLLAWTPAIAVAAIGFLFALAGIRALQLGRTISCACFGQAVTRRLGMAQVRALPAWLLLAFLAALWHPNTANQIELMISFSIVFLLSWRTLLVARMTLSDRGTRIAMESQPNKGRLGLELGER
jgi:methylamine utilization protein MauE